MMEGMQKQIGNEIVFKGSGYSHFSYVQGQGFHATTQVPGLNQGMPISIHTPINIIPPPGAPGGPPRHHPGHGS